MNGFFQEIAQNHFVSVAVLSWFLAQLIKTLLNLLMTKKLVLERMVGAGGMPSAHSAFVVSLMVTTGRICGWQSFEFAICFALASIVMYDATGVRQAAGQHAQLLNQIIKTMQENFHVVYEIEKKHRFDLFRKRKRDEKEVEQYQKVQESSQKLLQELLGHTMLEVFGGILLGLTVALLYPLP